jgi:hypothetical protein
MKALIELHFQHEARQQRFIETSKECIQFLIERADDRTILKLIIL